MDPLEHMPGTSVGQDPVPGTDADEDRAATAKRRVSFGAVAAWAAHLGALLPLTLLVWDVLTGGLSYDPVRDLTQRTGRAAFILLVLTIAVRPVVRLTGVGSLRGLARILGLYAFGYALLHLLVFVGLDFGFRWDLIVGGVLEKRFAVIGLASFLVLLAMAATSTKGWMQRLGALWKRIHRLVYAAGTLAMLHYLLAVKTITGTQLAWLVVVVLLFVARIPEVEERLGALRRLGERTGSGDAERPPPDPDPEFFG